MLETATQAVIPQSFTSQFTPLSSSSPEPYVTVKQAADFTASNRKLLNEMIRAGLIRAYPLGVGTKRKVWRLRLSELVEDLQALSNRRDNLVHGGSQTARIQ